MVLTLKVSSSLPPQVVLAPSRLAATPEGKATLVFGLKEASCRLVARGNLKNTMYLSQEMARQLLISHGLNLNVVPVGSVFYLGPLIGILSDHHNKETAPFGEQTVLFREIGQEAKLRGALTFVFTPYDINFAANTVHGYLPLEQDGHRIWVRRKFPIPSVIYDRSFFSVREEKITDPIINRLRTHRGVQFVNSVIGDKWLIHQYLAQQKELAGYLPETVVYGSHETLTSLLNRHGLVYLKPVDGSQGRGIIRLEKHNPNSYVLQYQEQEEVRREFNSWPTLVQHLDRLMDSQKYIVQQGIDLLQHEGSLVDLRIITQKHSLTRWGVTGMAARVGRRGSSVTNLHQGGHAVSIPGLLAEHFPGRIREISYKIEWLSCRVAAYLENNYGPLGELGIDLGLDRNGHLWYIESNPKPGRRVFILIGEPETRRKTIICPLEYAMSLAGFPSEAAAGGDSND